jgi:hypothetical protein
VWWNLVEFGGMGLVPFHHILTIVKLGGLAWWNCWHVRIIDLMDNELGGTIGFIL